MKGKVIFVAGGILGYVLGARAGRKRYEQIKRCALKVWNTDAVQSQVQGVEDFVAEKFAGAPATVFGVVKNAVVGVSGRVREATKQAPPDERDERTAKADEDDADEKDS